jgi:hypothetical protein
MSLKARAEQGLLEALAKPRKSSATVNALGRGEVSNKRKKPTRQPGAAKRLMYM